MGILNRARKNKNELNIQIYGVIGETWFDEGVTADSVYKELEDFGQDINNINIYINSPGGSVTDGCAIYSALKRHKAAKNIYIDGQCSSIATVIAMAGDKIIMSPVATMMIHDPITYVAGNSEEMRKIADVLDTFKETIINAYMTKTNLSREEVADLMSKETYFTSKQAIEKGFATEEMVFNIKNSNLNGIIFSKNINNSTIAENKGGKSMSFKNIQELEAENKDLVLNIREEAIKNERQRILDLETLNTETKGLCKEIIEEAKNSGKTKTEILENVWKVFVENSSKENEPKNKNIGSILDIRRQESSIDNIGEQSSKSNENIQDIVKEIISMTNEE